MSPISQRNQTSSAIRVGQTAYVCVYANKRWNDSGLDVVCGQAFNFVVPAGEEWIHFNNRCDSDGYGSSSTRRFWETFRRAPDASWLQLVASIGRTRTPFPVGSQLFGFSPPFAGRLYLFANHLPWMYWANKGMIAVRVTRTR